MSAPSVLLVVRFMSLDGDFRMLREERFATTEAALVAVTSHAASGGYRDVRLVDDGDFDGVRWTATTPGGRAGRNIAYGDFEIVEASS